MANKKGSRQLTWTDRISIEALKKAGHSVIEIAEQLGVHRSTIYNELKRGEYMHRN
ncbi:MAG: helix-turn-helix domain-containing protein, partial [Phascolarctobacterium faecium]